MLLSRGLLLPTGCYHRCRIYNRFQVFGHSTREFWFGKGSKPDSDTPKVDIVEDKVAPVGQGNHAPKPPRVLALPVPRRPLFPGVVQNLTITHGPTIEALTDAHNSHDAYVGLFLRRDFVPPGMEQAPELISDLSEVYPVGAFSQVHQIIPTTEGQLQVLLLAHRRIRAERVSSIGPPMTVDVSHLSETPVKGNDQVKAYSNELLSALRDVVKLNSLLREHMAFFSQRMDIHDPYRLADFAASLTTAEGSDLQGVMEEMDVVARLQAALKLVHAEREVGLLQQRIQQRVEEKMSAKQREYFLMEQLKSIKHELGMELDDKESLLTTLRQRAVECQPTAVANKVIQEELQKLGHLEKNSAEFNVTRAYLEWLTAVPWSKSSPDRWDVAAARVVLEQDHYGLSDVKERVLELVAVGALNPDAAGKTVCLVGPPGTGKTSIGKSIASALNREFYRFSVGGLSDVHEIKGHRRTYVGAMPGKVVQSLKSAGTNNPVIMIDEIDKLGRSHAGDPASALLELLDPAQHTAFSDHYLDVPLDLSNVLFICTANSMDTVPSALQDRMEVLRLSGYDVPEKVQIAKQYLLPRALRNCGLVPAPEAQEGGDDSEEVEVAPAEQSDAAADAVADAATVEGEREEGSGGVDAIIEHSDTGVPPPHESKPEEPVRPLPVLPVRPVTVSDAALEAVVRSYCREAGVRNLERHIERLMRKIALQVVEAGPAAADREWEVTEESLEGFLGKAPFRSERLYEPGCAPPGVVMGLAWTSLGGSALYVEGLGHSAHLAPAPAAPAAARAVVEGADEAEKEGDEGGEGGHVSGRRGALRSTGQMGDVMQESTVIAHAFATSFLRQIQPKNHYLERVDVHLHVPAGATPKDGPSAGVTMVTALLSLATRTPVADVAMTGELSLTGRVLPVGGIKEKVVAARRAGVNHIIMPLENEGDYEELPAYLKENLRVTFADTYADVYRVCFEGMSPTSNANTAK